MIYFNIILTERCGRVADLRTLFSKSHGFISWLRNMIFSKVLMACLILSKQM
jgi:hypothetical protein